MEVTINLKFIKIIINNIFIIPALKLKVSVSRDSQNGKKKKN